MDIERNLRDYTFHGKNLQFTITAKQRDTFRKTVRITMLVLGFIAAFMSAYMVVAALIREEWLIPFIVSTAVAVYVRALVRKK